MPPQVVVKWGAGASIWIELGFTTKCLVFYCHAVHEMQIRNMSCCGWGVGGWNDSAVSVFKEIGCSSLIPISAMNVLDGDDVRLSFRGQYAERDIVQVSC